MDEGLVFLKSTECGKCIFEYIPAKNAWIPVTAKDYMVINCLWVSGALKGKGYAGDQLNQCIKDSKRKNKKGSLYCINCIATSFLLLLIAKLDTTICCDDYSKLC
jgi:hypothetical protein